MNSSPNFSVSTLEPPDGRSVRRVDDSLQEAIQVLVKHRNWAICTGNRDALDATYVGLDSRDHSLESEDHERTSYYDWYINRIERGMGDDVVSIEVVPVYDFGGLPFKHNANWTIHQPEFELKIKTTKNLASWFIRRDRLNDDELGVILPNFNDPPWRAPILETRGRVDEFNSQAFSKELANHLGLEFSCWSHRLTGLVKIRAFALVLNPSEGVILPCFLTDNENFNEAEYGKWCIGAWRFSSFTVSPNSPWPYGEELCDLVRAYTFDITEEFIHPKFDNWSQPREDFEVLNACAKALLEPEFIKYLQRLDLSDDFETGVFHSHDENFECNFVLEGNQDLTVLVRELE